MRFYIALALLISSCNPSEEELKFIKKYKDAVEESHQPPTISYENDISIIKISFEPGNVWRTFVLGYQPSILELPSNKVTVLVGDKPSLKITNIARKSFTPGDGCAPCIHPSTWCSRDRFKECQENNFISINTEYTYTISLPSCFTLRDTLKYVIKESSSSSKESSGGGSLILLAWYSSDKQSGSSSKEYKINDEDLQMPCLNVR